MTATETRVIVMARPEPNAVALVRRALPGPGVGEAMVRVRAAGICGTDLHIVSWNAWAASTYKPPTALGHEFCGEIVELGPDTAPFRVGERVVAETHLSCGQCRQCRTNRRHTCANLKAFSSLNRGGLTELTVLPVALLRRPPDNVSDRVASIMEPLGIAVRAVMEAAIAGKDVLIAGSGPIGLFTIAVARHFGARRIVATDLSADRLRLAQQVGADTTIHLPQGDLKSAIAAQTSGQGVTSCIDTSGSAQSIRDALPLIETGGRLILTGLPANDVPLDLTRHVILREVSIRGLYGRIVDETWLQVESLLTSPRFDVTPILTHSFALDDFSEAFRTAQSGTAGKVTFAIS